MEFNVRISPQINFEIGQIVKIPETSKTLINAEIVGIEIVIIKSGFLVSYFVEYTDFEGDKITKLISQSILDDLN